MNIIRAFTTQSGFQVEEGVELFDWLRNNGLTPRITTDERGTRIATGVTDVDTLVGLLRAFHGEGTGARLRVFAEGSSLNFQDYQL
jgi:hypothetical protein